MPVAAVVAADESVILRRICALSYAGD